MDPYVAGLLPSTEVAVPQAIPDECPRNCWNSKTTCPDKVFEAPETSHTAPFSPRKHNHLPAQHTGVYDVMWADLDVWQDVLRTLSFDPTKPLDRSA